MFEVIDGYNVIEFETEFSEGEFFIIVSKGGIGKMLKDKKVGENLVIVNDDLIIDSYFLGNKYDYINQVKLTI